MKRIWYVWGGLVRSVTWRSPCKHTFTWITHPIMNKNNFELFFLCSMFPTPTPLEKKLDAIINSKVSHNLFILDDRHYKLCSCLLILPGIIFKSTPYHYHFPKRCSYIYFNHNTNIGFLCIHAIAVVTMIHDSSQESSWNSFTWLWGRYIPL